MVDTPAQAKLGHDEMNLAGESGRTNLVISNGTLWNDLGTKIKKLQPLPRGFGSANLLRHIGMRRSAPIARTKTSPTAFPSAAIARPNAVKR